MESKSVGLTGSATGGSESRTWQLPRLLLGSWRCPLSTTLPPIPSSSTPGYSAAVPNCRTASYLAAYQAKRPLQGYVRLRTLPGLAPAPEWKGIHWDLTPDLLQEHAEQWLKQHLGGRPQPPQELKPVTEVRDACITFVHQHVPRLRTLIERWHNRVNVDDEASAGLSALQVVQEMDADGLLDFEPLGNRSLIAWLSSRGYWPSGMPLSHRSADLGLDDPNPRPEPGRAPALDNGSGGARMPIAERPHLRLNDRLLSIDPDELREFAKEVATDLTTAQLTVSPTAAVLSPLAPGSRAPGGGVARAGGFRANSPDPQKTSAIELAGEIAVGAWLHQQYGVPPEESWKSAMRSHVFADGSGDDRLGYDFRIHQGDRVLLFEAKASIQADCDISLGESEFRKASRLGPHETYIIVYVSHVLDRERRRITPLPNPFGAPGLAGYRLVSTAMRLRFTLPDLE